MAHYTTMTSDKNKDTALLLCIFGGMIGMHQFYVGKWGKGFVYMFTGGFLCVGWILDIFKILLGSFTDNVGAPLRATKGKNNSPAEVKIVNEEVVHKTINQEDNITQIERLAKLRDQGIITQSEFEMKKQELLK